MVASVSVPVGDFVGRYNVVAKEYEAENGVRGLSFGVFVARVCIRYAVRSRTSLNVWSELKSDDGMDSSRYSV